MTRLLHSPITFLALPILALLLFGDVLISSGTVLSDSSGDLVTHGLPWREFGFRQLRAGHVPQWNPHIFAGMPYVGAMQSALFYPPNWLYLILPLGLATNWLIALHVCLTGLFMQVWAMRRGLHPVACVVAGAMLMFCGPHFLRVRAGHLPILFAMPWIVLTFVAIDECFKPRSMGWVLVGMGAMAMLILSGAPQYLFCTVVAGSLYAGFCLIDSPRWPRVVVCLAGILVGAVVLAAVQLLPGMDASSESVRGVQLPYGFVATYSLPPESLISLAVPGFFGDYTHAKFWGRWNMWESSMFMGAAGLALAVYGAIYGAGSIRRFSVTMVVILTLIAMGSYTPLLAILYRYVPGFDKFRAVARFNFPAAMFLCLLAGIGLDRLILDPVRQCRAAAILAIVAVLSLIFAIGIRQSVADAELSSRWMKLFNDIESSGQTGRAPQNYSPEDVRRCGEFAAASLLITAGIWMALAALLVTTRVRPSAVYITAVLAVGEMFVFAWSSRDTFDLRQAYSADVDKFLSDRPGDYRVYNTLNPDAGMMNGANDIWGYDSMMPLRYAEMIASTQGIQDGPIVAASYPIFPMRAYHPFYKALRFRYLAGRRGEQLEVQEFPDVLPRLQLMQDYRVIRKRQEILPALNDAAFDAAKTVILEDEPGVAVGPSPTPGVATLVEASTDRLVIDVRSPAPTILLVTDGWSKNWVARSADGSQEYRVMPADYVLRTIPLPAGEHLIHLEYSSKSYVLGKWISLLALPTYAMAAAVVFLLGTRTGVRSGKAAP